MRFRFLSWTAILIGTLTGLLRAEPLWSSLAETVFTTQLPGRCLWGTLEPDPDPME